jgi:hypothetical protein
VASVNAAGHVGLYFGPNVRIYGGILSFKINGEHAAAIGMLLNSNAILEDNLYSIYIENFQAMTAGTLLTTASGTRLRGRGFIWPHPSAQGVDGNASCAALAHIDRTTLVDVQDSTGEQIITFAPASDQYYSIATLPASSVSTHDKLVVELIGGPFWDSTAMAYDRVMMSNRGGFAYQYERQGPDRGSRTDLRILAYSQVDGTVQVWVKTLAGTYVRSQIRAYGAGIGATGIPNQPTGSQTFPVKPPTTTVPSGSIVFDSGDSTNYPPNLSREVGSLKVNGWSVNGGVASVQTIASSGIIALGTSGQEVLPVATSGAVTDVIIAAGAYDGQMIKVLNRSANTITFAAAGTSRVADGSASVVGARRGLVFVWDADHEGTGIGRWVRIGV